MTVKTELHTAKKWIKTPQKTRIQPRATDLYLEGLQIKKALSR